MNIIGYDKKKMKKLHKKSMKMIRNILELEAMFPDRHFVLDRHLVASFGVIIAAYHYGLCLYTSMEDAHDGTVEGRDVQVRMTQTENVLIREEPEYLIVLYLSAKGDVFEVYNGPGDTVLSRGGRRDRNGCHHMRVKRLIELDAEVPSVERIAQVRPIEKMKAEYSRLKKKHAR